MMTKKIIGYIVATVGILGTLYQQYAWISTDAYHNGTQVILGIIWSVLLLVLSLAISCVLTSNTDKE